MVFSSEIFIFGFLALMLLCYYILPRKFRNLSLLVFSLFFFYAWDKPSYAFVMVFSILFNFVSALIIDKRLKAEKKHAAKAVLVAAIVINIALLAFFKYTNLFISNINSLFDTGIPILDITLPIGISFYTFQTMSYTIDVYRRDCSVQKNIIDFAAYVTMFPQLIAGPIVRYKTIEPQLKNRRENFSDFSYGVKRFTFGLAKKAILANGIFALWNEVSAMPSPPVMTAWLGAIAYTFQIYFDFSGYSDMAIGMGKMLGFTFLENFDLPYISKSITEFWRRWHISLGTWFREYVYIPLGGNRRGKSRQIINLLIVWALTGFWHGASWNFLLWGLYFGIILIMEKLFLLKVLEKLPSFLQHIYSLLLILFGWVIFANEDFSVMSGYFSNLFYSENGFCDSYSFYLLFSYIALLGISAVCSTALPRKLGAVIGEKLKAVPLIYEILTTLCIIILLLVSIAFVAAGSYNPFLYFRF